MSNWFKLAAGWVLTVFVALAFSWGAIAQVRDRVDQPATVIPTSVIESAAESSGEVASTTTTLLVIKVEPEVVTDTDINVLGEVTDSTLTSTDDVADTASSPTTSASASLQSAGSSPTTTKPPATSGTSPTTTKPSSTSGTSPTTTKPSSTSGTSPTTTKPSSTTSHAPSPTTTSTTSPTTTSSTSTTSTTAAAVTKQTTYSLVGGSVTITYSPGVVNLVGASVNNGFAAETEKAGPSVVKVKFESDTHESEFTAKWENGSLKITKEENPSDGNDS